MVTAFITPAIFTCVHVHVCSGLALTVKTKVGIPVFALIRPRGGDFLYTDDEFQVMKMDVIAMCEGGIDGIVIGLLRKFVANLKYRSS